MLSFIQKLQTCFEEGKTGELGENLWEQGKGPTNSPTRDAKSRTWGPFLESPETLRAIFGCHNSLCISRIFLFVTLKTTCQKIGFPKQAVASFTKLMAFRARKVIGTFKKRAPELEPQWWKTSALSTVPAVLP